MNRFAVFALLGALGLAAHATPAAAGGDDLAPAVVQRLDAKLLEFTASAAKMRRMQIIQETMEQQRRGRGGYGRYDGGAAADTGMIAATEDMTGPMAPRLALTGAAPVDTHRPAIITGSDCFRVACGSAFAK